MLIYSFEHLFINRLRLMQIYSVDCCDAVQIFVNTSDDAKLHIQFNVHYSLKWARIIHAGHINGTISALFQYFCF